MKKLILFTIMIFICIFNIPKVSAANELSIDSDSLKNSNNEAYVSVTDLYGIPLFTEKITKQKEENEKSEKSNLENLNSNVFAKTDTGSNAKDQEFSKLVGQYNLFVKPKSEIKIKYAQYESSGWLIEVIIVIALLCMLTGILTRKYYKYISQKEEENSEYKDYVRF